jgi:dipeptidyl aminopeptidase/acylaminoacyl peptidase
MGCRSTVVLVCGTLLVQAACGGAGDSPTIPQPVLVPAPTKGTVVVIAAEHGNGMDPDGFSTTIDRVETRTLAYETSARYDSLAPGEHRILLSGAAKHCQVPEPEKLVTVRAGVTDTVRMHITCIGGLAYHKFVGFDQYDIAYLTPDGRTITLATGPGLKFIAAWSPDGSRMIYDKDEGTGWHFYSVGADGTGTRRLAGTAAFTSRPRWSPDGTRIAFTERDGSYGNASWIIVSDPDGNDRRVLVDRKAFDLDPVWSADGSRLYFGCDRFGRIADLCTTAADGTGLRAIRYALIDSIESLRPKCTANVCISIVNPDHFEASSDGKNILFDLFPYNGPQSVWAGAVDGSRVASLSGPVVSFGASWSPTGERVMLGIWDGASSYAIATARPDGSDYRQVTGYASHDEAGEFSPDGTTIAFDGFRAGTQQVWVMNADGSGGRQVTFGDPQSFAPHWNPKARATGTLTGGEPSTATSLQPRRAIIGADLVQPRAMGLSPVCHALRDGAAVRFSCPGRH